MTMCRVLGALALLFGAATVVLLYGVLDSSVSYTYCSDELERLIRRQRAMSQLVRALHPELAKETLMTAARNAGLEDEVFSKGPGEVVVSDVSFVFDGAGKLKTITVE